MIRSFFATLALTSALLAAPAFAQSLADLQKACGADIKALCAGVQPGGGRIKQCIMEKSDQLSPSCKAALASAAQNRANTKP